MRSKGRWWVIAALVGVVLVIIVAMVIVSFMDEPARRYMERQANAQLPGGYHVAIGSLDLHPLTLSVDLQDVALHEEASPAPPLVTIGQVSVDARFLPLLSGSIAAGVHLERPSIAATRQQVDRALELMAQQPAPEQAWQDRLRDMMPVRLAISISNGDLTYEGPPVSQPMAVREISVQAEHLTNRPEQGAAYPSTIQISARVLEDARVELRGRADVLRQPHAAVDADLAVRQFSIAEALAVAGRSNVPVKQGMVEVTGHVEYAPDKKAVAFDEVVVRHPRVEYVHEAKTDEATEPWQNMVTGLFPISIQRVVIDDGEVRYEGPPVSRPVEVREISVQAEHLTNRPEQGDAYPSTVQISARVLEDARVELRGRADVLRQPHAAVDADVTVRNVRIAEALSTAGRSDLPVTQGVIETSGHVEYAPDKKAVALDEVAVRHARVEYVQQPKDGRTEEQGNKTGPMAQPWQEIVTGLFPISIERLAIEDGEVRYQPSPKAGAIEVRRLDVSATHLRNKKSPPGEYPSTLRVSAHFPEKAQVTVDGRADFLARPMPGVDVNLKVQDFQLRNLLPLAGSVNVQVSQGVLDLTGRVQHSRKSTILAVHEFLLESAKIDYVHAAVTNDQEKRRVKKGVQKAKEAHKDPTVTVKVEHGKILHSDIGFVNKAASPDYRVFMADLSLDMDNFSNRLEEGTGVVKLTGKFMGSGPTVVSGAFRPEKPRPDFDLEVKIIKTKVTSMNNLLRAYGDVDTTSGLFALFSELSVKDNRIDGYVKPLLKDVEVYDPKQDQDKAMTQRLYEAVVGGVLGVLENRSQNAVATKTDVSGEIENPQADTWQVVGNLIQNAFFKAILPEFAGGHVG